MLVRSELIPSIRVYPRSNSLIKYDVNPKIYTMTWLTENPLPIAVMGALVAAFAAIAFSARRNVGSLIALAGVVAATLLMLAVERLVVTDREHVEATLDGLMAAIEANDVPAALAFIDPAAADMRADAQALMPSVKVDAARATSVEVELNERANPPTATSRFRGKLLGLHPQSGTPITYVNQQVDVQWIKRDGRWLADGYTAYFDGKPIDAVGSARSNRPVTRP